VAMSVPEPTSPGASGAPSSPALNEDALIILPVRNVVLFPQVVLPISMRRELSVAAAQEAVKSQRKVGLLLQRDAQKDDPTPEELHRVGTVASIVRYLTAADGTHHLICQGEQRFSVLDFLSREPFLVARIQLHPEPTSVNPEIEARALRLRELANEALQLLPQAPPELATTLRSIAGLLGISGGGRSPPRSRIPPAARKSTSMSPPGPVLNAIFPERSSFSARSCSTRARIFATSSQGGAARESTCARVRARASPAPTRSPAMGRARIKTKCSHTWASRS